MARKKKVDTGNKRLDELLAKLEKEDQQKLMDFIENLTFEQLKKLKTKKKNFLTILK